MAGATLAIVGLVSGFAQMSAAQDANARAEEAMRNQAAAQKEAVETQRQMQAQEAARSRRQAIRAGIVQRAQLRAQAQAAGLGAGGSLVGGATGSVSSQVGANLGFSTMMSGLGAQYSAATSRAADFGAQAGIYSQRAQAAQQGMGMGFNLFSQGGGFGAIKSGFGNFMGGLDLGAGAGMSISTPYTVGRFGGPYAGTGVG